MLNMLAKITLTIWATSALVAIAFYLEMYIDRQIKESIKRVSNLAMMIHTLDNTHCYFTYRKRDNFWVVETEEKQFWFDEEGNYYRTI